jgi:hypothetical protein
MKYILAVQTPWDSVKYINDDLSDYSSHSYNKFLEMIMNLKPFDPNGLKEAIDSFETVYLNVETKQWEILKYTPESDKFTPQQMYELNPSPEMIEEQKKNESIINRTKNFIDQFSKDRVNKNINKFKDKEKTEDRTKKRY